ncbi:hypothetical protein [Lysinibacillus fusiformis]|uniref:hypothetical protein n=1 Tax=Lysinibacillus fusiformis TaxID=28031 RepID=UPI003D056313
MIESKSWFDYVIYVALVLLVGGLIWSAITLYQGFKERSEAYDIAHEKLVQAEIEIEENQYKTLSDYLKEDEKNIIISSENGDGFLVKTNKKSYTVIFNDNGKEIEKIIEN